MLASRGGRSPSLLIIFTFLSTVILLYYNRTSLGFTEQDTQSTPPVLEQPTPQNDYDPNLPGNATLGFGALYVVSGPGSPRRNHIEQAAAVTGLELRIPSQREWTDEDVRNFRADPPNESKVGLGSVKAWLSHHVVLRDFLDSGLETALIFEDDVDWDIALRTKQVPLAQEAAHTLFNRADIDQQSYPWGSTQDWDLFYLGHCGDYFNDVYDGVGVGHNHPYELEDIPHVLYDDPTMMWRTDIHPFTASLLTAFKVPEHKRVIHESRWPLCTFGYAVTRHAAQLILSTVAPPNEDTERGVIAYDAALMVGCRDRRHLRCFSVNPEFFHHMEGRSIVGELEETERVVFRPPVDKAGLEQTVYRKETSNIGCGFWSGDFYYDSQDQLDYLREEVGVKNRCLKPGRDDGVPRSDH